jgi:hypothetical protein
LIAESGPHQNTFLSWDLTFKALNGDGKNKLTVFNENVEDGVGSHIAVMSPQFGLLP